MDFGFAFGKRGKKKGKPTQGDLLRAMFTLRQPPTHRATTLVDQGSIVSLNQLIVYLTTNTTGAITRPIGNLMLGSHASDAALELPMYVGQNGLSEYETLQVAIDDPTKSIEMTTDLIGPDPGVVNFRGCNIGKSQPFLDKWKEALGNVRVSAPKHFHGIFSGPDYGYWESLVYEFAVNTRGDKPFTTLADLKAAFRARTPAFAFVDGTTVPDAYWDNKDWLPNRLPAGGFREIPYTLHDSIGSRTTIGANRGLLVEKVPFKWHLDYETAAEVPKPDPPAFTNCIEILKASFEADASSLFNPPFPVFERQGYGDLDEFVSGHSWTFSQGTRKGKDGKRVFMLLAVGTRISYTLLIPVTDPAPAPDPKVGKLITNFFPLATFDKVPLDELPDDGLVETDARYFGITT